MAQSRNDAYRCMISSGSVSIVADLPQQFSLGFSSQFESIDQSVGIGSVVPGSLGQAADIAIGTTQLQSLSYAVWRGTSPIVFPLSLLFDAETNSKEDVHNKLVLLASLTLPRNAGAGVLVAPTPSQWLGGGRNSGDAIRVRIGRQYLFDSVAVESANLVTESRMNAGFPIAGQIDLQIRTIVTYSKDDWFRAASMAGAGENLGRDFALNSALNGGAVPQSTIERS